jgi:hypothetical protein
MHTDIHVSSGIWTNEPSVRAGEDGSCLRPRDRCDRLTQYQFNKSITFIDVIAKQGGTKSPYYFHASETTRWFKYYRDWFVLIYTQISPGHIWIFDFRKTWISTFRSATTPGLVTDWEEQHHYPLSIRASLRPEPCKCESLLMVGEGRLDTPENVVYVTEFNAVFFNFAACSHSSDQSI